MNIIKKRNILQNELNKIEEQIKALKQQQMLIENKLNKLIINSSISKRPRNRNFSMGNKI